MRLPYADAFIGIGKHAPAGIESRYERLFPATLSQRLSPGQHVISVSVTGPTRFANPTKTVMAEKGQTYSFTATWQGKHLVLLGVATRRRVYGGYLVHRGRVTRCSPAVRRRIHIWALQAQYWGDPFSTER